MRFHTELGYGDGYGYDELDVDVASYSVNSLGAGMSIGYPISETSRLTYGLSVQRDQIDTGRYTVDEIYDFLDKEGDNSPTSRLPSAGPNRP